MTRTEELMIYRNFEDGRIFEDMVWIMDHCETEDKTVLKEMYYETAHALIEMAGNFGFSGNLWHNYLTYLLVNNENVFSTACEIVGKVDGTMNELAKHDFEIFRGLYGFDFQKLDQDLGITCMQYLRSYQNSGSGKQFNQRIRDRIDTLTKELECSESVEEFMEHMIHFYKEFGVGKLGLHKAFRIVHEQDEVKIVPITRIAHVRLEDLVGYENAKQKLIDNTEAFIKGKRANNCLLFGDAGTGKSSSIKGILNQYYDQGLRVIEVYKHQFQDLNDVIAQVKNRNYKFIIYMDDLSFEDFEIEYKYLKAVIEGGLERKPDNILIYATSNRRHLVREKFSDKEDRRDDLHSSDTVQEKLSLVNRFGVQIFFCAPSKKEFQNIVKTLAEKNQVVMDEEELLLEANKWELSHGGLSGRTAQQFIDYLLGKM